jgi:hypothetical protein
MLVVLVLAVLLWAAMMFVIYLPETGRAPAPVRVEARRTRRR